MKYKYLTPFEIDQIKSTCAACAAKCGFPTTVPEYEQFVRGQLASAEALHRMHWEQFRMKISPNWPLHLKQWTDELRCRKAQVIAEIGEKIVNS